MIFRTLALLPLCAMLLAFSVDAEERRFDCTVVAVHDDASLGCRPPGADKALSVRLNAIELPAAQPWRQRARQALEGMLLGKPATIREQGRDARFRILGAAWVTPADCPACGHTLDAGLALLTIGLASWRDAPDSGQTPEARGQYQFAEEEARAREAGQWGPRDHAPRDGSRRT
ncbi:thermonuclease family protein [Pseudomonas paraeruginosa]|uniref:thermonuclease family protein n=1 Tax=Pseudomonas paraeruginosa TaxID=2994495 RepID=UPI0039FCAE95